MPRSWKEHWPMHNDYTEDDREDAIYCLGNLAMLITGIFLERED